LYVKGKHFVRIGKKYIKTNEEKTIDAKDITGTRVVPKKTMPWLIAAIAFFVCSLVSGPIYGSLPAFVLFDVLAPFHRAFSLVLCVVYLMKRGSFFEISFTGGVIAFGRSWSNHAERQTFQHHLHLADKGGPETQEQASPPAAPRPATETSSGGWQMDRCKTCGAVLPPDAPACEYCGAAAHRQTPVIPITASRSSPQTSFSSDVDEKVKKYKELLERGSRRR
jgi:ribosomal protein L40E